MRTSVIQIRDYLDSRVKITFYIGKSISELLLNIDFCG